MHVFWGWQGQKIKVRVKIALKIKNILNLKQKLIIVQNKFKFQKPVKNLNLIEAVIPFIHCKAAHNFSLFESNAMK